MKAYPQKFTRNGIPFRLYKVGMKAVLYEIQSNNYFKTYEVWLKKVNPERLVKGIHLAKSWKKPSDEAFGKWAWSFKSISKALTKFRSIEMPNYYLE